MLKIFLLFALLTITTQNTLSAESEKLSMICVFKELKGPLNSAPKELQTLGTSSVVIDPNRDFDVLLPEKMNEKWKTRTKKMRLSGSVSFPKPGWIGLAFDPKPGAAIRDWAATEYADGKQILLIHVLTDNLSIEADCNLTR